MQFADNQAWFKKRQNQMAQKRKNAIVDSKIFCTFAQKIKGVKEPPKINKQQYLN